MRAPRSILGKYAPSSRIGEEDLFVVLKSYFDKSGQEDQELLTLSGIAASDEVWKEIEGDWLHMLNNHNPRAEYMHMIEAVHLRQEFSRDKGWDDDKVFGLINQLMSYLTDLPKDGKYCQFGCTLKIGDYTKLQAEGYQMDSPVDLLAIACVRRIQAWYLRDYGGLDLEAHYYFDTGEPFEPIIKARWGQEIERAQEIGEYNDWAHISHIGSAVMRKTPGLQVADMLAWATNRYEINAPKRYSNFATALRALVDSSWTVINEAQLRRKFRPLIYKPYEKY
jgi:hypothetical protein